MANLLVSICIPTYNRARFLAESLRTICAQDYRELEILISDNASTDNTEEISRQYVSSDRRIRYIRHPKNIGLYGNHNFCIHESRGSFLGLFHDDDTYELQMVTRAVQFLLKHPKVGIVCSDWRLIDDEGRVIGFHRSRAKSITSGLEYIEKTLQSGRSSICLPGTLIRRSALGNIVFNEEGPIGFSDFIVWFQIAETTSIGHINEYLWSYRQHKGSLSRRKIYSMTTDYFNILTQYCKTYLERWPHHTKQIHRWERKIHRFLFWALVYEICLSFYTHYLKTLQSTQGKTLFERMAYQLTPEELQEVRKLLLCHQRGFFQRNTRLLIEIMLRMHLTRLLAQLARYPETFRVLLGLK